jgi:hypothetical protein
LCHHIDAGAADFIVGTKAADLLIGNSPLKSAFAIPCQD